MTDITDMTDAELDALLGLDDEPAAPAEQTWQELLAEGKAMRIAYLDASLTRNGYHARGPRR